MQIKSQIKSKKKNQNKKVIYDHLKEIHANHERTLKKNIIEKIK